MIERGERLDMGPECIAGFVGSSLRHQYHRLPMTAVPVSEILNAAGIPPSALRDVLPDVDPTTVTVRVAPRWFRAIWAKGIVAVALPFGVFVQPAILERHQSGGDTRRLGRLMVHELTHIQQWRSLGAFRHTTQYTADYLKGRWRRLGHWEAYRAIRLEVEARQVADAVAVDGPL